MKRKLLILADLLLMAAVPLDLSEWPICADPILSRQTTIEEPAPAAGSSAQTQEVQTYQETVSGKIYLRQADFPDFSLYEKVSRTALPALLPSYFQDKNNSVSLNIPEGKMPIKFKNYVEGQSQAEKDDPNKTVSRAETDSAFIPLVSATKTFAAMYMPGEGTESLNFVLPEITPQIPPEETTCAPEGETASRNLANPNNPDPNFTAAGIFQKIVEIIGNIVRTITKKEVIVHSRGYLYGGKALNENSEAINSFLPEKFTPEKEESSGQASLYEVSLSPGEKVSATLKYQGQKAVVDRYCRLLRGVYPAAFSTPNCD
jgi:hypothetical protein